jgi:hypothetical protein
MTRIATASLQAFLAFGNASIAVCEVKELARGGPLDDPASDLLAELRAAHVQLRELFAQGLDDAVCVLARDVMDLVSRTTDVLNQGQGLSGS